ncbi:ribonuclease P protein component [Clostridium algidicarnis]|uniref:Ribonuclease P protein component n=2 Tax=Clostridium algidicarnis TaxID=37659 RepID=A0A2S6FVY5_9CLOT|nr:ribonuclease P protein component [Clostridium algidicarnis]MBB6629907.1 ribonuclease P protein component [Clostridium algidicarnis]MBB6697078.1 ribonuclease P protein component [Clostridium algidicarnis]MBU3194752.1 ribonuclease P protein component [Clostridium algidicarnis]MBU3197315.1 ribonuclease P protein component [Clostridium algidicarnis]MBU3204783.1 ribonuclease P protein component [Clostridium algidicarnis]
MKVEKLRKNVEFRRVYRRGKSFANELLVLYVYKNYYNKDKGNMPINRVGISVSKKVGKSVTRSKVKRLISENYRLNCSDIKKGFDFVFVARVAVKDKDYFQIENSMKNLFKKAGLMESD